MFNEGKKEVGASETEKQNGREEEKQFYFMYV